MKSGLLLSRAKPLRKENNKSYAWSQITRLKRLNVQKTLNSERSHLSSLYKLCAFAPSRESCSPAFFAPSRLRVRLILGSEPDVQVLLRYRLFFDPTTANRRRSCHKPFPSNLQSAVDIHPGRFPSRSPCRPPWHWLSAREVRRVLHRKYISNLAWVALEKVRIGSLNDNSVRVSGVEMPTMLQRVPYPFQPRSTVEDMEEKIKIIFSGFRGFMASTPLRASEPFAASSKTVEYSV